MKSPIAAASKNSLLRLLLAGLVWAFASGGIEKIHGEAMLELFNVSWPELTQKMPEIAEAGYDSLWLPPPEKGSSVYSVGYDAFDPFDLGSKNQNGTIATHWGTQAQLLEMVETAHRFGIRVYFDNVMNHRAFTTPGFDANTPTNFYPGLVPADFHLQTVGKYFQNWPSVQDYNNQFDVQNESLDGLIDLANEPGTINSNFGPTLGSTTNKPFFIRHPNNPEYYMDTNLPAIGGSWHPFNGTNGEPVAEDVTTYEYRAAMWTIYTTKCDGFRMDAVKHVPSAFFGNTSGSSFSDDPTFAGYDGGIQAIYDYVHGYGNNVINNGYVETDGNRNSVFDTEAPRNDAMLFGEHLGQPPTYEEYLERGMRLLNAPLQSQMNNILSGNASLSGLDQRDYSPGAFSQVEAVQFAQSQDQSSCCATHRELQNAYYFMHEGLPEIYSDGYNQSQAPVGQFPFPNVADANYLGEFGDNQMPDIVYLHNQLARGGSRSRWSDQNIVAFERYDYRDVDPPALYGNAYTNADATVVLFAMNDKFDYPGDINFDDGITRTSDGYYLNSTNGSPYVSNSRNVGLVVGFPPGSILVQLSSSGQDAGGNRAYQKLLVHYATTNYQDAVNSANDPNPANRLIYVGGQTLAPGGGAIELLVPSGGWVMYGYQWPETSRATLKDAITFYQNGVEAPRITVFRTDGTNGDANFNPLYPFKMRGSVDEFGNVITGSNVSNLTYAIDIPVITNTDFDIQFRCDASASNILAKLDGGIDLNSQMGLGATNTTLTNILDLRDNPPGIASDVYLGYEQAAFQLRNGPEKFAAQDILSNNIVSLGAETYSYIVGQTNDSIISGSGYGQNITNQTANWVWHDPTNTVTSLGSGIPPTQRFPLKPTAGQSADVWVKVGYQFQISAGYIYYTTDGTDPDGSFGEGRGTTKVVSLVWINHDSVENDIDWWKGTIPAADNSSGAQIHYKIALFNDNAQPISDADSSKLYGLTKFAVTNFNPTTALVWLHNDLNPANTVTGLQSGFHIVRARAFVPRAGKSGVYNTFLQTFYYDAGLPTGIVAFPVADGNTISNSSYTVVIRADDSVTGVDFNIQDSNPSNDDVSTGQANGNGQSNGVPVFVSATQVTPDPTLDAQYPNYPKEFRFNYANVPGTGTATITIHLKDYATGVYSNRFTTLTRTISTLAPPQVLEISSPPTDGTVIPMGSNVVYLIQACFTPTLTTNDASLFSLYINGVLQPRASYIFRPPGSVSGCAGLRSLLYNWSGGAPGTNIIQVIFNNNVVVLSDTRIVIVPLPLRISNFNPANQTVVWDSTPGLNYEVLATTNLSQPFEPISDIIPATGLSTFYYDDSPSSPQKFYEVRTVP
ncbi:MAG TPA: alpha-amylase family glycosyl hydrolase [Verrucomicrobiae bacterium]|nr:alpha-amylase family glycosyl hydrolase [Verrucomicrobiae bacterium]